MTLTPLPVSAGRRTVNDWPAATDADGAGSELAATRPGRRLGREAEARRADCCRRPRRRRWRSRRARRSIASLCSSLPGSPAVDRPRVGSPTICVGRSRRAHPRSLTRTMVTLASRFGHCTRALRASAGTPRSCSPAARWYDRPIVRAPAVLAYVAFRHSPNHPLCHRGGRRAAGGNHDPSHGTGPGRQHAAPPTPPRRVRRGPIRDVGTPGGARDRAAPRRRRGQRHARARRRPRGRPRLLAGAVRRRRRGPVAAPAAPPAVRADRQPRPRPGADRRGRRRLRGRGRHGPARDARAAPDRDRGPRRQRRASAPSTSGSGSGRSTSSRCCSATSTSASWSCTTGRPTTGRRTSSSCAPRSRTRWRRRSRTPACSRRVREGAARLRAIQELSSRLNRIQDVARHRRRDRRRGGPADRARHDPRLHRRPRDRHVRADRVPRRGLGDRRAQRTTSCGCGSARG